MKMVATKLSSQAITSANAYDKVGKLLLSNSMTNWCNYFGSAFLERCQQFPLADALHAAQVPGKQKLNKTAALYGQSYSDTGLAPPCLHQLYNQQDVYLSNSSLGLSFITHPPSWSFIKRLITGTYILRNKINKLVWFPQAHGQLMASLIASNFSRWRFCQPPSEQKRLTSLLPRSKPSLKYFVEKQGLTKAEQIMMTERVMK